MKYWQQVLRENDPGRERMDAEIAARMREQVVRTGRGATRSAAVWPIRFALAAFACLVVMISLLATQRPVAVPDQDQPAPSVAGTERRQIQFATPGGTRIIWEINPDFTMGDTIP
jgi:hypothetical protein